MQGDLRDEHAEVEYEKCPKINIRLDGLPADFRKSAILKVPVMINIMPKVPDLGKERRELLGLLKDQPASKKPREDGAGPSEVVDLEDSPGQQQPSSGQEPSDSKPSGAPEPLQPPPRATVFVEREVHPSPTVPEKPTTPLSPPLSQPIFQEQKVQEAAAPVKATDLDGGQDDLKNAETTIKYPRADDDAEIIPGKRFKPSFREILHDMQEGISGPFHLATDQSDENEVCHLGSLGDEYVPGITDSQLRG